MDGNGQGIEKVFISVYEVVSNWNNSFGTTTTGPGGAFSIAAPPGMHDLHFMGEERASENQPAVNVVAEYLLGQAHEWRRGPRQRARRRDGERRGCHTRHGAMISGARDGCVRNPLVHGLGNGLDLAGNQRGSVLTDADGSYTLTGVPVGGAKVRFNGGVCSGLYR